LKERRPADRTFKRPLAISRNQDGWQTAKKHPEEKKSLLAEKGPGRDASLKGAEGREKLDVTTTRKNEPEEIAN